MQCPKCNANMQKVSVGEYEVDRCMSCDGIWFDLREHEHLREQPYTEAIDIGDTRKGESQNAKRDINCPRCNQKMVKLRFPDQPHISYEQCATCGGVYLDAGEFTDYKHMSFMERAKHLLMPLTH